MPEQQSPEAQDKVVVAGPIGSVIAAGGILLDKTKRMTASDVIILGCLASMVVISGLLVYNTWLSAHERELDRTERAEREARVLRFQESQEESLRQHCLMMTKELSRAELERDSMRMRFYDELRNKDRATVQASIDAFLKWRDALGPILKKMGMEEEESVIAPRPRIKDMSPQSHR